MINKEQLKQIINDLSDVVEEKVSFESVFKEACSYQRGLMIGEKKQTYNRNQYHQDPATEKQKNLIKKINKGIVPAGISKKDATILIGELKK